MVGVSSLSGSLSRLTSCRKASPSKVNSAPPPRVGRRWVGHGVELGAREVVAVHGDEGGDGRPVWKGGCVSDVESRCEARGEGCLACVV